MFQPIGSKVSSRDIALETDDFVLNFYYSVKYLNQFIKQAAGFVVSTRA